MKTKNTIILSDEEIKLLMASAIFAGSVDFSATWGSKIDVKFIKLAKNVSSQSGITDISKFLNSQLDVEDDRMLENPTTFKDVKSTFILGEE